MRNLSNRKWTIREHAILFAVVVVTALIVRTTPIYISRAVTLYRTRLERERIFQHSFVTNLSVEDPKAYKTLVETIDKMVAQQAKIPELRKMVREVGAGTLNERFENLSAADLKKLMQLRISYLRGLYKQDEKYMYLALKADFLQFSGTDTEKMEIINKISDIVMTPEDAPAFTYNEALAQKELDKITESLSVEDVKWAFYQDSDSPYGLMLSPPKMRSYCEAYFRLHEKITELDDEKAVQVLWFLESIPREKKLWLSFSAESPDKW